MKKWLIAVFILLLAASIGISYGFESEPSLISATGENLCCVSLNGMYYGKACTQTDRSTYLNECEYHYCEVINGYYYDRAGNIVDKQTFTKECPDVNLDNNLKELDLEKMASWLWQTILDFR